LCVDMRTDGRFAMALHVLTLVAHRDGDPVTSNYLSASVNTNPVIIRRLLLALQKAKLIKTAKGPRAGSRLSRSPARISLADIYRATKCSSSFGMPRKRPNDDCPVGHCIGPLLKQIFLSAQEALERELEKTSLSAVLTEVRDCASRKARGPRRSKV
jgi:DNA-binding IscR family transcriptional regulator